MWRFWILCAVLGSAAAADDLPRYDVLRARSIVIDGKLNEFVWRRTPPAGDFHFNWWTGGEKEQTVAKMLWDNNNLYLGYYCHDKHISATVTKHQGPVYKDDCVEVFISPNPDHHRNYYGFEINAIGAMLNFIDAAWRPGPPQWEPEGVRYATSCDRLTVKADSPKDDHWTLELAIPWKNFARDAAHIPPRAGDTWRLNLSRCGGTTNAQYSTWSPVHTPKPNFHVPDAFGWVRFVDRKPAGR